MQSNKLFERLELKPVELKHIDQFDELMRYVFQVTNRDLAESGYEEGELLKAKKPLLENSDVFGWFNGEELVSQICIIPCKVNIHGSIVDMGGVTGVGTYPEYSNHGLMSALIKRALQRMREHKQSISYLFPYSTPYYRRKGWEIMSDHLTFKMRDTQVPHYDDVEGYVEREDVDHGDVMEAYNRFAQTNHGAMIRGEMEWVEYWRWDNEEEHTAAIYYNTENEAMGFMFYRISEDVFHIKEMVWLNQEARKGLWNFVRAHDSMIDEVQGHSFKSETLAFQIDDSHITETVEPYFMARIVDLELFLTQYPFREVENVTPFHFVVSDSIVEWNNGIFGITPKSDGTVAISREAIGQAVHTNIQTLTCMLLSYRRPRYLYKMERLQTDPQTLSTLTRLIPNEQPYFSDYF